MDRKWKEADPSITVQKIQEILQEAGIGFTHRCLPKDILGCCSSRIELTGRLSAWASNGKGVNEDYCAASAHAEMMERLQNRVFFRVIRPDDSDYHRLYPREEKNGYRTAMLDEVLDLEPVAEIRRNVENSLPAELPPFSKTFISRTLFSALCPAVAPETLLLSPFYCPSKGTYVGMPKELFLYFTGSNGMAAGNTLAEAIVQACCELLERHAQKLVMKQTVTPPDVPRPWIERRYPELSKLIKQIEENGKYRVVLKDCSLGRGLPVVCGAIINLKTGGFGLKFGAHPSLDVAIERVFTESLQGRTRDMYTRGGRLVFGEGNAGSSLNLWNMAKASIGDVPASLFTERESHPFSLDSVSFPADNRQAMLCLVDLLEREGGTVYIEDVSYLGFPSVYVYAQNLSAVDEETYFRLKEYALKAKAQRILHHIDEAADADVETLLTLLQLKQHSLLENTVQAIYGLPLEIAFPAQPLDLRFLMAACRYRLGQPAEAVVNVDQCVKSLNELGKEDSYVLAVRQFLFAIRDGLKADQVAGMLRLFFEDSLAEQVLSEWQDPGHVLAKLYPACPDYRCDECENNVNCTYADIKALQLRLARLQIENGAATQNLHKLF